MRELPQKTRTIRRFDFVSVAKNATIKSLVGLPVEGSQSRRTRTSLIHSITEYEGEFTHGS